MPMAFSFALFFAVASELVTAVWRDTEETLSSGVTVPAIDMVRLIDGVGGKLPVPASSIPAVQFWTLLSCAARSGVDSDRGNVVSVRAERVGEVGVLEGGCAAKKLARYPL